MDTGFLIRVLIAIILALLTLAILHRRIAPGEFHSLPWYWIGVASFIFWGVLATGLMLGTWESYYSNFYPTWVRWLAPMAGVTYFLIGLLLRWLSLRFKRHPAVFFALLGGIESIIEHLWAIFGADILAIPILRGSSPTGILFFAFFEYVVYWGLTALLAVYSFRLRQYWHAS